MPIYEFYCSPCELAFEALKPIGETSALCPVCSAASQKREVSQISISVPNGNKRSVDHIIGEDAARKWQQIHDEKSARDRKQYGDLPEDQVKTKEAGRIGDLVAKQNAAYSELDKAKKEAGITKNDELRHALGSMK